MLGCKGGRQPDQSTGRESVSCRCKTRTFRFVPGAYLGELCLPQVVKRINPDLLKMLSLNYAFIHPLIWLLFVWFSKQLCKQSQACLNCNKREFPSVCAWHPSLRQGTGMKAELWRNQMARYEGENLGVDHRDVWQCTPKTNCAFGCILSSPKKHKLKTG